MRLLALALEVALLVACGPAAYFAMASGRPMLAVFVFLVAFTPMVWRAVEDPTQEQTAEPPDALDAAAQAWVRSDSTDVAELERRLHVAATASRERAHRQARQHAALRAANNAPGGYTIGPSALTAREHARLLERFQARHRGPNRVEPQYAPQNYLSPESAEKLRKQFLKANRGHVIAEPEPAWYANRHSASPEERRQSARATAVPVYTDSPEPYANIFIHE